jgi:hypothetical protein
MTRLNLTNDVEIHRIRSQHDPQGKRLLDPDEGEVGKQDHLGWSAEMLWNFGARIYGEKHGLNTVCTTGHQTKFLFFDINMCIRKLGLIWRSSYRDLQAASYASVNSRVKHTRARKTPTQVCDFFGFHLLNTRLFGEKGSFMGRTGNNFYWLKAKWTVTVPSR